MSGEKKEKLENKIRRFLAEDKYKKIIIIAGFVAIALIFLSNFFEGGGTPQQDTQTVITGSQSIAQYKQETEQLLADMIASIEGAGTTKILVTVDSSEEYVYLANEKESVNQSDDSNEDSNKSGQSSDTEKDYIIACAVHQGRFLKRFRNALHIGFEQDHIECAEHGWNNIHPKRACQMQLLHQHIGRNHTHGKIHGQSDVNEKSLPAD